MFDVTISSSAISQDISILAFFFDIKHDQKYGLMVDVSKTSAFRESGSKIKTFVSEQILFEYLFNKHKYPDLLKDLLMMSRHHKRVTNQQGVFNSFWVDQNRVSYENQPFEVNLVGDKDGVLSIFIQKIEGEYHEK